MYVLDKVRKAENKTRKCKLLTNNEVYKYSMNSNL
jgi:hypothetical protein